MSHTSNDNEPASAGRNQFADANVICTYTRDDGIRDGVFVDVTDEANAAGFQLLKFVDLTASVHDALTALFDAKGVPADVPALRAMSAVVILNIWRKALNAKTREMLAKLRETGKLDASVDVIEIKCPVLNREIWAARTSNKAGQVGLVLMFPEDY
jgi:hypothetical protein